MQKLAKMLEQAGIDYEWIVYTNRKRQPIGNNVIYKDTELDIIEEIAKADYLVQLSDCESYCYSVVEALTVGTPVIVTDLPVFKELGLKNGLNAYICDFNMKDIQIDQIAKKSLETAYKPPKSNWGKYLSTDKTYNPNELVEVRTLKRLYLVEEYIHAGYKEKIKITKARASELEAKGLIEW
jgi:glycosyltransferase involved in cell wall biosynthesis